MGGRASIVGAAETSVGKVRDHNEDAHFIDPEAGIFIVCDGMGGHAAGEVASAIAVKTIRAQWSSNALSTVADSWLSQGTADARKRLLLAVQQGVLAAHEAIVAEAEADRGKSGMGTTLVGAVVVGGDIVFAHCGDSRAYLVRDGIAMQLTEDHTLLARLLAAGVDVDVDGDGSRFKSMLTNALGIGQECKVSTFVVPVADGDRFLLCSDGITEYVLEHEVGEVLTASPSPARAAQRLIEMALSRGGGDNATALVVRVLEAGETSRPAELLRREDQAIHACPLWAKVNPQQRLRSLRIALPRDYAEGEKLPAQTLGDRVAWIIVEGELEQDGHLRGPGSLIYPEAMLSDRPLPDKDGLAVCQSEVRGLAIRSDDFRELCDDDPELGQALLEALATEIQLRRPHRRTGKIVVYGDGDERGGTDPGEAETLPPDAPPPRAKSNTDLGVKPPEPPPPRSVTIPPIPSLPSLPSLRPLRASSPPPTAEAPKPPVEEEKPAAPKPPAEEKPAALKPPAEEKPAERKPPDEEKPAEPRPRLSSSPRLHARGSTPPSSLIAAATDVEGDLDRALTDLEAEKKPEKKPARAKTLEPADDEDAEIVVASEPETAKEPANRAPHLSEPEISIEELEDAAEQDDDGAVSEVLTDTSSPKITMTGDHSEPEIVVKPLVASDPAPPNPPRAKRQSDGWD